MLFFLFTSLPLNGVSVSSGFNELFQCDWRKKYACTIDFIFSERIPLRNQNQPYKRWSSTVIRLSESILPRTDSASVTQKRVMFRSMGAVSVLILAGLVSNWVSSASGINLSPNEKRCFTSYTSTLYPLPPGDGDNHALCIRDCAKCANNPRSSAFKKKYCRDKYDHCVRTKGNRKAESDRRTQQCLAAFGLLFASRGRESKASRSIFRTLCIKDCNTRNGCPPLVGDSNPLGCLGNRRVCQREQP